MNTQQPFPGGTVDWSGENPCMYLKDSADGPIATLLSLFRVVMSPHGRGRGLVLVEAPDAATSRPEALNVCVTDNEPLARWLIEHFVTTFGPFRGTAGLAGIEYRALHSLEVTDHTANRHEEHLVGEDIDARLAWADLGTPYVVNMPPAQSTTGKHRMLSLFIDAGRVETNVNGRVLRGQSHPRDYAGRPAMTAFLAFSETWVRG